MTLEQFMEKFAAIAERYKFRVRKIDKWIRGECEHGCLCPLTAVWLDQTGEYIRPPGFTVASKGLGVNDRDEESIASAADNHTNDELFDEIASARKQLVDALNLTEAP